jgi:hypothetical protein
LEALSHLQSEAGRVYHFNFKSNQHFTEGELGLIPGFPRTSTSNFNLGLTDFGVGREEIGNLRIGNSDFFSIILNNSNNDYDLRILLVCPQLPKSMNSQSPITFDSTLASVLSHDFRVSSTTLGQVVAKNFAQNPNLPGVIVMDETRLLGMISRTKFREQMNTLQRENLYFNSPIQMLLDYLRIPPLLLDHNSKIADAVNSALNRSKELIYEPIVIVCENNIFRIIDAQVLLLAQNQILNHAQNIIQQQQSQIKQSFDAIKAEKNKIKKCSKYYQNQQELIKRNHQDFLKVKQQEIFETAQKITEINEDFLSN